MIRREVKERHHLLTKKKKTAQKRTGGHSRTCLSERFEIVIIEFDDFILRLKNVEQCGEDHKHEQLIFSHMIAAVAYRL